MAILFTRHNEIVSGAAASDANDGLDPVGASLTDGTYDLTGHAEGESHLDPGSGALTNVVAGDLIYLSGGVGITVGLYEVATVVASGVLLTTTAGTDSTGDVTSSNGPNLTFQGLCDGTTDGDEGRLCADSTYSPTARTEVDTNASTVANGIILTGATTRGVVDGSVATVSGSALPGNTDIFRVITAVQLNIVFKNIRFTAATRHAFSNNNGSSYVHFQGCRFDNCTNLGVNQDTTGGYLALTDCEVDNNGGGGCDYNSNWEGGWRIEGCSIHDNTGVGVHGVNDSVVLNSCIYDNTTIGMHAEGDTSASFTFWMSGCTVFGNTGDGIDVQFTGASGININITNTIVRSNGGFGIDIGTNASQGNVYLHSILSHNNTSGHTDVNGGVLWGDGHITSDPTFVSETDGSEDFGLQAGSPAIGVGMPDGVISGGDMNRNIGAAQQAAAAAGGAPVIGYRLIPGRWGGWR